MIMLIVFLVLGVFNAHIARRHTRAGNPGWAAFGWSMTGWCAYAFFDHLIAILNGV
jgi:disulfide bond formation protein DsbB